MDDGKNILFDPDSIPRSGASVGIDFRRIHRQNPVWLFPVRPQVCRFLFLRSPLHSSPLLMPGEGCCIRSQALWESAPARRITISRSLWPGLPAGKLAPAEMYPLAEPVVTGRVRTRLDGNRAYCSFCSSLMKLTPGRRIPDMFSRK